MKTVHAILDAGRRAFQNGDYAKAVSVLLPLAHSGNGSAEYYRGLMCHEGKGLPEDNAVAAGWARKAAEHGSADAEALLGVLYANGQGVPRNTAEAARWFHNAAERGNAFGQSKMGLCYLRGAGVTQNCLIAYMWFDLASIWLRAIRLVMIRFAIAICGTLLPPEA